MKKNRAVALAAAILLALLALVACRQEPDEQVPTVVPVAPTAETQSETEGTAPQAAAFTAGDYTGIPWQWVAFTDPATGPQDIPNPELYQMVLNADGTIDVTADCKGAEGTYTVDGQGITIELGPTIQMICSEESLADQFLANLSATRIMFFDNDDLIFDLFADAGTMRFSAGTAGVLPETGQPAAVWSDVMDRLWVLVGYGDALNPSVVPEGALITANFSSVEQTVSGSGGCNNYFAGYEAGDDGSLTISGPIGSTMMFCEQGGELEADYFAALETGSGWTLNAQGRLELTYSTGQPFEERLVFTPGETSLNDTVWRLVNFGDPDNLTELVEGTSITALFTADTDASGTLSGNATCNNYTTGYTLDGDAISVGPIAGTLMLCPVGAEQETAYLAALQTAQTFEIVGATLRITYEAGVLNYSSLNLPLENVLWQATMVAGQPVPEGAAATALFMPGESLGTGSVGGRAGCNDYSTSYETSTDHSTTPPTNNLSIPGPIAVTARACLEEAVAELENAFLTDLEAAESYTILGDQLVIHTENGDIQLVANRESLEGTLWTLVSWGLADLQQVPPEGSTFTAQFSRPPGLPSGTVVGETGCNQYNATFTASLTEIKVNLPATTRAACTASQMEAEQQFFLGLNAATTYRILGSTLQIPYGEGEDQQVLTFAATHPPVEEAALDLSPLADTFWYLLSIGDNALLPFTEITADFTINEDGATGTISGSSGCNAYNAPIGENFAVGPIATTQRACVNEVIEQEGGYLDWLSRAYDYSRVGDQLLISTGNGVLTYNSTPVQDQRQELQNRTWYLVSVGNLTAVPFSNATTFFSPDGRTLTGNTGCNEFSGSYSAAPGNTLTISGFTSTFAACPTEDLTRQEEALRVFLQSAISYTVYGTQMQIQTVDGSVINYTAVPPAQPAPPTAVMSGNTQAEVGQQLTFDGSQSRAGSTPIVRYDWDMGDGTLLSGVSVQYTYNTAGAFTVRLTVSDQAGQSNTASTQVTINPVQVNPPTAVIEGPTMAFVGEPVTFSAAGSQPGSAAISGYDWQSGDGNNSGQVGENSFTTIYSLPGTYFPTVTVIDASGLSDSASLQIVVNATLDGTDWFLTNANPGTSITINFANGNISGFAGCNTYNASYTTTLMAGNTNQISVGPITSTQVMCSEEIMAQEQAYLASLQTASSYIINGTSLTLTTTTGSLVYGAVMAVPLPVPVTGP